jgi:hypothetical protein
MDDDLAIGLLQNAPQTFIELQFLGGKIESRRLLFPGITFLFQRVCGSHRFSEMIALQRMRRDELEGASVSGQTFKVYAAVRMARK